MNPKFKIGDRILVCQELITIIDSIEPIEDGSWIYRFRDENGRRWSENEHAIELIEEPIIKQEKMKEIKGLQCFLIPSPNGSKTVIEARLVLNDGYQFRGHGEGVYGEFPNDVMTIVNLALTDVVNKLNGKDEYMD